jgi:hypothetical protein
MDGRERIAELLTNLVSDVRAGLDSGHTPAGEASNAMMFYVLADHLLGALNTPDRPMTPWALAGGLRQLQERCRGSLDCLRAPVAKAVEEAENLDWDYRTA